MICPSRSATPSRPRSASAKTVDAALAAGDRPAPYGTPFWWSYVANSLISMAVALLYRYADLVVLLGGTEYHLGWIVGIGMIGSLAMRFALGAGIDQYGPRRVWLASLALFAVVCLAHLAITTPKGVPIYLLRIAYFSTVAGIFGSSIAFVSGRVSMARMAELVGMLGTSGFMGIVVGTLLGDLICGTKTLQRWQIDAVFVLAGGLALLAMVFAWLATRHQPSPVVRRRRPPIMSLLWRYQPGTVLVVGITVGAALALPTTFLRTYAAELGIPRISWFFAVYSSTAIITRVATRRTSEQIGLIPMILLGLGAMTLAELAFLIVGQEWQFVFPAIGYGVAHAILFPTITAAGTISFPYRYRGLGTMVILAAFDAGGLVGLPVAGAIVHFGDGIGLSGYPTMFAAMAGLLVLVGGVYAMTLRPGKPKRPSTLPSGDRQRRRSSHRVLARSGGQS